MPAAPRFDNSYVRLPDAFHDRIRPTPVARPEPIMLNRALAEELGLDPDWLAGDEGMAMLSGNALPSGSDPIAMGYAGHQFGQWVPRLGDGRAILLGEVVDNCGERRDIQLKGAGPTPYSRRGDGRSSIGPVVREYLASEFMHALGIPTTRALAAISTGEDVVRQKIEPGGILCRVARSHVRVGTFEFFARSGRGEEVRQLADYVIDRHYPDCREAEHPYRALLSAVIERQARLVGDWLLVGFIHGVMNTDNCSIIGETIDYGPFGFIDRFHPGTVYSAIDRGGRYAYNQQPAIAHWNLARLAECLLDLLDDDRQQAMEQANRILGEFPQHFEAHFHRGLAAKIGLSPAEAHAKLALDLMDAMAAGEADMTLVFRNLGALPASGPEENQPVRSHFKDPRLFDSWAQHWRAHLAAEGRDDDERRAAMDRVNPAFILRNHLAQHAVDAAIERLDFQPMHELHAVLSRPYEDQPQHADLAQPPRPDQQVLTTFCGT
ncbi:protein adenylyltransferase SelO [Wenzhouxiangella limi]|uniref:Protein nucleotidyltransferase YdiU n=1 Tax=Wenzhouxiangella limi TaxID=2707351 RepID=A0A845VD18_9GAMM|nr:YdiU family protein [Wenzhouxiangella limi]NDY95169.1 YdiU family protein [Wenzhouxiangella limi]